MYQGQLLLLLSTSWVQRFGVTTGKYQQGKKRCMGRIQEKLGKLLYWRENWGEKFLWKWIWGRQKMTLNTTYEDCVGVMGLVIVKVCTYGAISSKNSCVSLMDRMHSVGPEWGKNVVMMWKDQLFALSPALCLESEQVTKLHLFCPYCMYVWQGSRLMSWQECTPRPLERETSELLKPRFKSTSQLLLCTSWLSYLASPLVAVPPFPPGTSETSQASEEKAAGCGAWHKPHAIWLQWWHVDEMGGAACGFFQGCWKSQMSIG